MKKTVTPRSLAFAGLFAALTAAGAFIRIPVPVVPFTLQVFFTTMAGLLLGGRLGAISVGVYIALGLIGLPVFTQGGGPGYVFVPTFGYIIGFCAAAYITGTLAHKSPNPSYKRLLTAALLGLFVVYLLGVVYYALISDLYLGTPIGLGPLLLYCFVLPVPGDIALCFLAAKIAKISLPFFKRSA